MEFPAFYSAAPEIILCDRLAAFLGVSQTGVMTYSYADAVKLSGHSCPTVAGAYLMVRRGLSHLYGDRLPDRGGMEVYMRAPREEGTTGVVATLLTGAKAEIGFNGIGEHRRFARRDLLHFDIPLDGIMALRRSDNGMGTVLDLDMTIVPFAREMQVLLPQIVAEQADEDEQARFAALWQARVEQMLTQHADDPELVQVREWTAAACGRVK